MGHQQVKGPWTEVRTTPLGTGRIMEVEGRSPRKNGLPMLSRLVIENNAGNPLDLSLVRESDQQEVSSRLLIPASWADFDFCPICLSSDELTSEHIPSGKLGGTILTRTCKTCNNRFGSLEEALLRATEQVVTLHARSSTLRGERKVGEMAVRQDSSGALVLMQTAQGFPDWYEEICANGVVHEIQLRRPCQCVAYVALLKNAFLMACVIAPDLLATPGLPAVELVRKQLINWRDSPREHYSMDSRLRKLKHSFSAPILDEPISGLYLVKDLVAGTEEVMLRMGPSLIIAWPVDAVQIVQKASD